MADKLWKQAERGVARVMGGERIPVSGRQRGFSADIKHSRFSIEVKHRKDLPSWLLDAMNQADLSNDGQKVPVAILHQKGMKYEDCLVVLRLSDLITLEEK